MSTDRRLPRRTALGLIGGAGVGLGCGAAPRGASQRRTVARGGPLSRVHAERPLPFDPESLRGLSARLIRSHHENNYRGAVRKLNACRARLASLPADAPGFEWGGLAKSELALSNSVTLHELYFENLGGDGAPTPVQDRLAARFGSVEAWRAHFVRCALSLAGGSGWVILALDRHRGELAHRVCADHGHAGAWDAPLLVLDMYEHSYHLDYGAAAERYVEAFLSNVHWERVAARLAAADAPA